MLVAEPQVKKVCGAKTRAGHSCPRPAMSNGKCYHHGGATPPPGPSHPNYRHGFRSKLRLKPDLARRLNEAAADPELMTVNRDVEALEVRQGELLERIDSAASEDFCSNVLKLLQAIKDTDAAAIGELLPLVEQQATAESRNIDTWKEYERVADSKRKLIDSHRKAQSEAGQMILLAQHVMTMDRLVAAAMSGQSVEEIVMNVRREYAVLMGVYEPSQPRIEQVENGSNDNDA